MMKKIMLVGVVSMAMSGAAMADGFYLGGGLGGLLLKNDLTTTITSSTNPSYPVGKTNSLKDNKLGINGTVLAGYAWEDPSSYFVGLEAFDNDSSAKTSNNITNVPNATVTLKTNNIYGVRALPGLHFTPDTVGYGILGIARGDMKLTSTVSGRSGSTSYNLNGYQVGVGTMTDLNNHIGLRTDLIYTGYRSKTVGSASDDGVSTTTKLKPSTMELNVVAVYKFG